MTEPPTLQGEYAGFVTRFIALAIDLAIATGMTAAVSWVMMLPADLFGIDLSSCSPGDFSSLESAFGAIWCVSYLIVMPIVLAITFAGYFIVLWTLTGWTIGKGLLGLRVVRMDGRPMNLARSLIRYWAYFVSLIPLGAGFWWVLISDRRQGWHDKIAGTYVLYSWEAKEHQGFLDRIQSMGQRIVERRSVSAGRPEALLAAESAAPAVEPPLAGNDPAGLD